MEGLNRNMSDVLLSGPLIKNLKGVMETSSTNVALEALEPQISRSAASIGSNPGRVSPYPQRITTS